MTEFMTLITFLACLFVLVVALDALVIGIRTRTRLDVETRVIQAQALELDILRKKNYELDNEVVELKTQLKLVNSQYLQLLKYQQLPQRG